MRTTSVSLESSVRLNEHCTEIMPGLLWTFVKADWTHVGEVCLCQRELSTILLPGPLEKPGLKHELPFVDPHSSALNIVLKPGFFSESIPLICMTRLLYYLWQIIPQNQSESEVVAILVWGTLDHSSTYWWQPLMREPEWRASIDQPLASIAVDDSPSCHIIFRLWPNPLFKQ